MNFLIKIRKEERKGSRGFWRKVSYLLTLQRAGPYSDLSLRVLFNQPGSSKATASQQHYHIIQWLLTFKLTKSSQISHIHVCESHSVMSDSLRPHGLYSPWNSPGQNTGVGGLSLLQGIFPNHGLNPGLPHCRQILYQLSHKGSPSHIHSCDFNTSIESLQGMKRDIMKPLSQPSQHTQQKSQAYTLGAPSFFVLEVNTMFTIPYL